MRSIKRGLGLVFVGLGACTIPSIGVEQGAEGVGTSKQAVVSNREVYGPKGVYVLWNTNDTVPSASQQVSPTTYNCITNKGLNTGSAYDGILSLSYVDGISVRISWSSFQGSDGASVQSSSGLSTLTSALNLAASRGKKVTLIITGVDTGPSWLSGTYANGQTTGGILPSNERWTPYLSTPGGQKAAGLPWSATAKNRYASFISALSTATVGGVALKDHPQLANIDASILGFGSYRPSATDPSGQTGYVNVDTFKDAIVWSVDQVVNAFPNKAHYFPYFSMSAYDSTVKPALKANYVLGTNCPHPNSVALFAENLSCDNNNGVMNPSPSASSWQFDDDVDVASGFQMLTSYRIAHQSSMQANVDECNTSPWTGPGTASQEAYTDMGSKYFEIYCDDFNTSSFRTGLNDFHNTLWGSSDPADWTGVGSGGGGGGGGGSDGGTDSGSDSGGGGGSGTCANDRVRIDRYYSATQSKHVYLRTTESPPSGYTLQSAGSFCLDPSDSSATVPLYRCTRMSPPRDNLSTSATCTGGTSTNIGYIASAAVGGSTQLYSLYKSSITDYHYAPTAADRDSAQSAGYSTSGQANWGYVWLPQ